MYRLGVERDFIASHFLFGGDWGDENALHAHHYKVEIVLEGRSLDSHGYLVDICDIEQTLTLMTDYYRDKTLNDLAEFEGTNPSIEHFARIFCQSFLDRVQRNHLTAVEVKVWENDIAWASYRETIEG